MEWVRRVKGFFVGEVRPQTPRGLRAIVLQTRRHVELGWALEHSSCWRLASGLAVARSSMKRICATGKHAAASRSFSKRRYNWSACKPVARLQDSQKRRADDEASTSAPEAPCETDSRPYFTRVQVPADVPQPVLQNAGYGGSGGVQARGTTNNSASCHVQRTSTRINTPGRPSAHKRLASSVPMLVMLTRVEPAAYLCICVAA